MFSSLFHMQVWGQATAEVQLSRREALLTSPKPYNAINCLRHLVKK